MFGNRLGWGISSAIILCTTVAMLLLYKAGSQIADPGPIGLSAAKYTMQLPLEPRSLATWMSEDGDAVAIYKEAIADYDARPLAYRIYSDRGKLNSPEYAQIEKGVNLLVKAATIRRGGVFADRPAELITYDTDRPALKDALLSIANVAMKVGKQLESEKNVTRAREIYRGVYTLGLKLYEERMVWDEWDAAVQTLAVAKWLGDLAESADEARRFKQVQEQIRDFAAKNVEPVHQAIMRANPPEAGDIAALAVDGGDVMWRVEATLALGRCRYTSPRAGDQFGATKLIDQLLADPEPRVRLAAQVAKSLTREGVHQLR